MAILPDFMIRALYVRCGPRHCPTGPRHVVEPFIERTVVNGMSAGVSHAGYDIRSKQGAKLAPGDFVLLSSVEHFVMPGNCIATVRDKSTWARRGLSVFNTVIEPGWTGYLTIEAVNHGPQPVKIQAGDPIAQIIFEQMMAPPDQSYSGKYMDQPDRPVAAMEEVSA